LKRELKPGDAIRRARSAGKSVGIAVSRAARPMLLPDELAALLADALDAHANGHRVELVVHAKTKAEAKAGAGGAHSHYLILDRDPNEELTTQQAAEALKVSRPTIIQAIEDGRLAARKVGKHRRVRVYDFNAFARAEHATRVAHARESDRMEQELGLYDIPLPESITEWKRTAGRIKSVAKASARRGKR
jgi:excisionase family DNA binding protein